MKKFYNLKAWLLKLSSLQASLSSLEMGERRILRKQSHGTLSPLGYK